MYTTKIQHQQQQIYKQQYIVIHTVNTQQQQLHINAHTTSKDYTVSPNLQKPAEETAIHRPSVSWSRMASCPSLSWTRQKIGKIERFDCCLGNASKTKTCHYSNQFKCANTCSESVHRKIHAHFYVSGRLCIEYVHEYTQKYTYNHWLSALGT